MDVFDSGQLIMRHAGNDKKRKQNNLPLEEVVDVPMKHEPSPSNPNLNGTPTETFTEEELNRVYDDAFDQPPADDEGYEDESEEDLYRHLKYWTMYNKRRHKKRMPLPTNSQHFDDGTVIAGWLQPPPGPVYQLLEPVYIVLDNVLSFSFDRLPSLRGFWVQTTLGEAWYWLQEPCDQKPPDPYTKSQAEIHINATVALATMSLLADRIFTEDDGPLNAKRGVDQILRKQGLLPIRNIPSDDLILFETSILACNKTFIFMLMMGHIAELTDRCKFMMTLKQLAAEPVDMKAKAKWTRAVAQYCNQTSWGGPLAKESTSEVEFVFESSNGTKAKRKIGMALKRESLQMSSVLDDDCSSDEKSGNILATTRVTRRNSDILKTQLKADGRMDDKRGHDSIQQSSNKKSKREMITNDAEKPAGPKSSVQCVKEPASFENPEYSQEKSPFCDDSID